MKDSEIIRWSIGSNIKYDVIKKMNYRAIQEKEELIRKGNNAVSIKEIHKESVSRGEKYRTLIQSVIEAMDIPNNSICADLGSGTGTCAALVSLQPRVKSVYAVEISEQSIIQVMPEVFDYFNAGKEKIIGVVGDFNKLEFEDNYLDFAIEMGSFHHSEDISKTISECFRVLKPSGFLLAIERARPNSTSNTKINYMLDKQLSSEMKEKYGIPQEESYTRRMWGEHEYTFNEWDKYFKEGGFENKIVLVHSFLKLSPFRFLLKKICSVDSSAFQAFYLHHTKDISRSFSLCYDLLTMPVFICIKPRS
jgi:ubiquinone/menaquinone biosynthesis C-methylase UbiE